MRVAKTTIAAMALTGLLAGLAPGLNGQATPPPSKSSQAPKQAVSAPKQPKRTAPAKPPARSARAGPEKAKAAPAERVPKRAAVVRRDPFDPLVSRQRPGPVIPANLPPGKAGLIISTLRIDGLVRGPNGMIAVVTNPQQRTYFLREGDQLYDGRVERITMDAVQFHEVGKDAFGKPIERQVTKRLYPVAGEQP